MFATSLCFRDLHIIQLCGQQLLLHTVTLFYSAVFSSVEQINANVFYCAYTVTMWYSRALCCFIDIMI